MLVFGALTGSGHVASGSNTATMPWSSRSSMQVQTVVLCCTLGATDSMRHVAHIRVSA